MNRTYQTEYNDTKGIISSINIAIVGSQGVGKTTFVTRHQTGDFTKIYSPTMMLTTPLVFRTTKGVVNIYVQDYGGQYRFDSPQYRGIDGAIVMFDVTSRLSYKAVDSCVRDLRGENKDIPIVLCGNKVDCRDKKVQNITKHRTLDLTEYYDVSAKSNYNFEKPFLRLLREKFGNDLNLI